MQRKYYNCWLVFLGVIIFAIPVLAQNNFSRNFKSLRLPAHKVFTLTLESCPTTGFSWQLTRISPLAVLEFVKREYQVKTSDLPGSLGAEVWSFRTLQCGRAVIRFENRRVWEKEVPAAKIEEFYIFVE